MIRVTQSSLGDGQRSFDYDGVATIQGFILSGWTFDALSVSVEIVTPQKNSGVTLTKSQRTRYSDLNFIRI